MSHVFENHGLNNLYLLSKALDLLWTNECEIKHYNIED